MAKRVELVWDRTCPHANATREQLRTALQAVGASVEWAEWDREDPHAPAYARALGSPTVLVDGRDVSGPAAPSTGNACRLYQKGDGTSTGIPLLEDIIAALVAHDS